MPRRKKKPKSGIITVYIPDNLIEKVKNTVYWTPGLTITSFGEKAIENAVDTLESGRGEPFSNRNS